MHGFAVSSRHRVGILLRTISLAVYWVACTQLPGRLQAEDVARYRGVESCARCHEAPSDRDKTNKVTDWVHLNEYATWTAHDAHTKAYDALLEDNDRMRGMRTALEKQGAPALHKDRRCLACHAIDTDASHWDPEFLRNDNPEAIAKEGVSCEVCHGASSLWSDKHNAASGSWRFKPTADKQALGMKDVRDPEIRAHLCLSCHVGNVKEGKVVTHEMFAAGHPPLPGFEMEAFGHAMPTHWRHLSEKPKAIQERAAEAHYTTEATNRTDSALIGALVAMRQSANLLAQQATKPANEWPELSHYDCASCHHDLRRASARQERGYGGLIPGRPSLRQWPREIAALAYPSEKDFQSAMSPITRSLNQQPFGDYRATAGAANETVANLDKVLASFRQPQRRGLSAAEWSGTHGKDLLKRVCGNENPPADLDSARQLGWLLKLALKDSDLRLDEASKNRIRELFVEQVSGPLKLTVHPRGYDPSDLTSRRYWEESLDLSRDYDPEKFAAAMKAIYAILFPRSATTAAVEP